MFFTGLLVELAIICMQQTPSEENPDEPAPRAIAYQAQQNAGGGRRSGGDDGSEEEEATTLTSGFLGSIDIIGSVIAGTIASVGTTLFLTLVQWCFHKGNARTIPPGEISFARTARRAVDAWRRAVRLQGTRRVLHRGWERLALYRKRRSRVTPVSAAAAANAKSGAQPKLSPFNRCLLWWFEATPMSPKASSGEPANNHGARMGAVRAGVSGGRRRRRLTLRRRRGGQPPSGSETEDAMGRQSDDAEPAATEAERPPTPDDVESFSPAAATSYSDDERERETTQQDAATRLQASERSRAARAWRSKQLTAALRVQAAVRGHHARSAEVGQVNEVTRLQSQFVSLVKLNQTLKKDLRWRTPREYRCRQRTSWCVVLVFTIISVLTILVYGLQFGETDARNLILVPWLFSFIIGALMLEPAQILLISGAPCLFDDSHACGRCVLRTQWFYNEYLAP